MSRRPSTTAEPTLLWVDIDLLDFNPWNANVMDDEMFAKAVESIHRFGFVDPVTVRELGERYQVIDGEHRVGAARRHSSACSGDDHVGLRQLPITNLGVIEDHVAKQLTIVLNETRGEYEPKKMGALLTELLAAEPMPQLLALLPFTKPQFEELAQLPSVDWGAVAPKPHAVTKERWVERVYRVPADGADAIDEAISAAKAESGGSDGQALVELATKYLGGA